jgi:hypothetical protein
MTEPDLADPSAIRTSVTTPTGDLAQLSSGRATVRELATSLEEKPKR